MSDRYHHNLDDDGKSGCRPVVRPAVAIEAHKAAQRAGDVTPLSCECGPLPESLTPADLEAIRPQSEQKQRDRDEALARWLREYEEKEDDKSIGWAGLLLWVGIAIVCLLAWCGAVYGIAKIWQAVFP